MRAAPLFSPRALPPREQSAAWLADPLGPHRPAVPNWWAQWCMLSPEARVAAQAAWTHWLRVLLPDANSAPSAARREALWRSMSLGGTSDHRIAVQDVVEQIEEVLLKSGLVERPRPGQARPRQLLFTAAALRAAATEVGSGHTVHRRSFRLLLMRMHQYLDVHAVLAELCDDPQQNVRRDAFDLLLLQRCHTLTMTTPRGGRHHHGAPGRPAPPQLTPDQIFERLMVPGQSGVHFDRLATWSMRNQFVRPGSGATVRQPRWAPHLVDPASSVGVCHSPTMRGPSTGATHAAARASASGATSTGGGGAALFTASPTAPLHRPPPPAPLRRSSGGRLPLAQSPPATLRGY